MFIGILATCDFLNRIHMYYVVHTGCIRTVVKEAKQWELQVDHSLFAITKLDVTVS